MESVRQISTCTQILFETSFPDMRSVNNRKRSDGLETMDRLLEFAEEELRTVGPVKFNLVEVLARAGLSRSSAYHHFGDREGLIAAVELKNHIESMRKVNELLRSVVETSSDPEILMKSIEFHLGLEGSEKGFAGRRRRIFTLAAGQASAALAERISEEQRSVSDYLAGTIEIARAKGMIRPMVSDMAITQMMLAAMFGRALVDLTGRPEDDTAWLEGTLESLRHLLNIQEQEGRNP